MITPKLERVGQVEVPFQGAFFLGDGFPMATTWAEREVAPCRASDRSSSRKLIYGVSYPASRVGARCGLRD
jgi:hypothetical protein